MLGLGLGLGLGVPMNVQGGGPRIAGSSLAYALGDSRTGQNIDGGSQPGYGCRGSGASWARRRSAQKLLLPLTNINGGSGETAATIRATRYPSAEASAAKILLLLAGVNQGASLAQDLADITYMAQTFAASGGDRICFVYDELPVGAGAGWNPTQTARHAALRDGIRALHSPASGVYVIPSWRACTGGNDGDTPLVSFYGADGVHPITKGGFLIGEALLPFIESYVPAFDPYSAAVFAIDTTLNGANFSGSTGNAISVASLLAANDASSRMAVDGATTWAELTLNGTSSVMLNPSAGTLPTNIIPGVTTVSSILKAKIHAGAVNVRSLEVTQVKQSGQLLGTNAGRDMQRQGDSFDVGPIPTDSDVFVTLRTPPVLVSADALAARWQLGVVPDRISSVAQTMTGIVSVAFAGMIIE